MRWRTSTSEPSHALTDTPPFSRPSTESSDGAAMRVSRCSQKLSRPEPTFQRSQRAAQSAPSSSRSCAAAGRGRSARAAASGSAAARSTREGRISGSPGERGAGGPGLAGVAKSRTLDVASAPMVGSVSRPGARQPQPIARAPPVPRASRRGERFRRRRDGYRLQALPLSIQSFCTRGSAMRTLPAAVLALLAVSGGAAAQSAPPSAPDSNPPARTAAGAPAGAPAAADPIAKAVRPRYRRELLTEQEIAATNITSHAFDLVHRLRPEWLRNRGTYDQPDNDGSREVQVWYNGRRLGNTDTLREINTSQVIEMRWVDPIQARSMYGPG